MLKRILICGSRDFSNYNLLEKVLNNIITDPDGVEIVSGHARGADMLGEIYAKQKNIKLKSFPAEWDKYGKRAGYIRNQTMLDYITQPGTDKQVVAFWDGNSKGTKNMIGICQKKKVPLSIVTYNNERGTSA